VAVVVVAKALAVVVAKAVGHQLQPPTQRRVS
jgi:hypothetical protein